MIFENGCTANVTVSRISLDNIRRLRIFQAGSFVTVDYGKKELTVIKQGEGLDENGVPSHEINRSCYVEIDALEMELKDFVSNVRNRTRPKVAGEEGRRALKVATDIIDQIKSHIAQHKEQLGL